MSTFSSTKKIGIIVGSTRAGRKSLDVAHWIMKEKADNFNVEMIDLATWNLPMLDEPVPAAYGNYENEHTKQWSKHIAGFDGFIFVTPEYNASIPGVLKNAIDYLAKEWAAKPAAIVSYGGKGGIRAQRHLTDILNNVKMNVLLTSVALTLADDFVEYKQLNPREEQQTALEKLVDAFAQVE